MLVLHCVDDLIILSRLSSMCHLLDMTVYVSVSLIHVVSFRVSGVPILVPVVGVDIESIEMGIWVSH